MSEAIDVRCEPTGDSWTCFVTVTGAGTSTNHAVSMTSADLARSRPAARSPTTSSAARSRSCSRASRRTRSSRRFDLPVIGRYFPDYEADDHPPAIAGAAARNASRPRSTISSLAVSETRNQPGFSTIVPGSTSAPSSARRS